MSAYTQFGYPYVTAGSQLLVPGQTSTASTAGSSCCETGRVVGTDPVSGAPICSCQYDSSRLSALTTYPRLSTGSTLHYSAAYPNGDPQNPYSSIGVDSGYFGTFANPYGLKEPGAADVGVYSGIGTAAGYGYSPYDHSLYGYGTPYDLASRRKNATRESTGTLKAWMNEHKKNPYPTKGEKIMLAIITKMTLTQISTWFANARRRLKKDNKMTWEPKNKDDSGDEEGKIDEKDTIDTNKEDDDKDSSLSAVGSDPLSPLAGEDVKSETLSPSADWKEKTPLHDCGDAHKPKIWSLADTAVCKTPPAAATAWSAETRLQCHEPVANTFPLPPTIGPGQFPRYPAHAQSQSQSRSLPQSSPTAGSYRHGSSAGGGTYGALATYGDAGRDTPPQTPPSLSKQGVAKAATAQHDGGVAGYGGPYPGMLPAPERRTEAYRQQPVTSQQYSHPRAGDVSQQMPSQMSQYGAAYKSGSSSAMPSAEYVTSVRGH